jgi:hypothetical protein
VRHAPRTARQTPGYATPPALREQLRFCGAAKAELLA